MRSAGGTRSTRSSQLARPGARRCSEHAAIFVIERVERLRGLPDPSAPRPASAPAATAAIRQPDEPRSEERCRPEIGHRAAPDSASAPRHP